MENTNIRMVLDVRERNTPNVVVVKKNDTARTLRIQLVDGNKAYLIGPDCTVVMTADKADGTKLFNNCTVEENVVVYPFTEQTCSCIGRMICEVRVIGSDGKMLTSASFTMVVRETAYSDGDTVSQGEADALALLVGQTTALRDELNRKLENGELVGPPGPAGKDGAAGERGPEGPQGIPGPIGPTGPQGVQGVPGPEGPQGPEGPAGKDGPIGPQGPPGIPGKDGAVSFDALTPEQIELLRGPQGETGATGPIGPEGPAGATGPTGATGPAGKDGAPGKDGARGEQGAPGPQGAPGKDGIPGKSAYQIALDKGFVGNEETWLASLVGQKGDPGPQGAQGPRGYAGAQGPAGNTPVKGVDYYTEADKNEMVNLVLGAMPKWTGGSY